MPLQPLSRRSQSATLAPLHVRWRGEFYHDSSPGRAKSGGGRGIRTPGGRMPTAVFKTAALDRSAIPPKRLDFTITRKTKKQVVRRLCRRTTCFQNSPSLPIGEGGDRGGWVNLKAEFPLVFDAGGIPDRPVIRRAPVREHDQCNLHVFASQRVEIDIHLQ